MNTTKTKLTTKKNHAGSYWLLLDGKRWGRIDIQSSSETMIWVTSCDADDDWRMASETKRDALAALRYANGWT